MGGNGPSVPVCFTRRSMRHYDTRYPGPRDAQHSGLGNGHRVFSGACISKSNVTLRLILASDRTQMLSISTHDLVTK